MSMEMRLCSEIKALFVEVYSDDDSTELSVTACVKQSEKDVRLDYSFFNFFLNTVFCFAPNSFSIAYYKKSKKPHGRKGQEANG